MLSLPPPPRYEAAGDTAGVRKYSCESEEAGRMRDELKSALLHSANCQVLQPDYKTPGWAREPKKKKTKEKKPKEKNHQKKQHIRRGWGCEL